MSYLTYVAENSCSRYKLQYLYENKGITVTPTLSPENKTGLIFFKFTNYWIILLQNETEFCIFTSLKRRHTSKCKAPMYVYVYYVIVLPSKSKIVS